MFLHEYPGVRFSRRFRLWEIIMLAFASLLARRLTNAAHHSFLSRRPAAEFSAATLPSATKRSGTSRGLRAAERASHDALRPNHNSVNIEDHYGISFIRERLAASTWRRLPQKGRRSPVPAKKQHSTSAGEKIALGQVPGLFQQRKPAHREGPATRPDERIAFERFATFELVPQT